MRFEELKNECTKLEKQAKTALNRSERNNLYRTFTNACGNGELSQVQTGHLASRIIELNEG